MKNILYIFLLLAPTIVYPQPNWYKSSPMNQAWKNVGNAGFSERGVDYISLAYSLSGEPYVAYRDFQAYPNDRASVMKFDGVNWVYVGNPDFSAGRADYTSIAFSQSGQPYVAYMDWGHFQKATVMKFDGTNWVNVGNVGFSAGTAECISIAFSFSGQLHIAYRDWGNSAKTTVMKFDGTDWVNVGSPGFSAGMDYYTSLAFNPTDDQPFVAYLDYGASGKATVMKFDGTNWVNVGNGGFSTGRVDYISLAFNLAGQPYVAYADSADSSKATVKHFDGTSWVNVGNAAFSTRGVAWTSLAFSPSGQPYVAFSESSLGYPPVSKATVMKFDGTNWVYLGSPGFSAGTADYTCLAFSSSGQATVAYSDHANINKSTVMKYDSVFVGINEQQNSRLILYPNPSLNSLTIDLTNIPGKFYDIEIIDIRNINIFETHTDAKKIVVDLTNYLAGVYFVKLKMTDSIYIEKFCKN
jgi:hypothetical protein